MFEHKLLLIPGAYIAVGIFVFWFLGEMRRIDGDKIRLKYQGFTDNTFAVYKSIVVIATVALWPFLLRRRWSEPRLPQSEDGVLSASKQSRAAQASPEEWRRGQILLNDFVIERELGEGGMGRVYLVKSRTSNSRFAVKRAKGLSERERQYFLAELQTWIDLPEHPNLVACRFFRTVGDEVLIFAEYVGGGSLKNWIDSRKIYHGGEEKALERLLNIAIQFAWGLHCVHELELVHQDVKPANVLIDEEEQECLSPGDELEARVTDYGLARARAAGGERHVPELGRIILVSSGGYTPAYCSPEQAAGHNVDRRTDVWSWGVSVMEMFQGGVTWQSGSLASEALEAFLEHNGEEDDIPAMPAGLADILIGCFRKDPAQRWQSMEAIVQKLKGVYQAALGTEYGRVLSKTKHRTAPKISAGERRTRQGLLWRHPQDWLRRALQAEGRDPGEAAKIMARHASSRRGQLVADIAAYDEARRIYERLIHEGRNELEYDLSILCLNAACVHEMSDDFPGALALYDCAIEILMRLIKIGGRSELAHNLVLVCEQKANVLASLGNNRAAVDLYDHVINIIECMVKTEGSRELARSLASVYASKAVAIMKLGDNRAAISLYDQAIKTYSQLANVEGQHDLANSLATVYMNKAIAVGAMGDQQGALSLYDQAIEIRERLVNVEGRHELSENLARLHMNKAVVLAELGDKRTAVALFDRAIDVFERLITDEGRLELANDLAGLYMNKAPVIKELGERATAIGLLDRAIEIREWLVNVEGRGDLANYLANLYVNKANTVVESGDAEGAEALYDKAIEILEHLIHVEGRRELANDLAVVYANKANMFMILGNNRAAVAPYDRAIEILERLINIEGRRELANSLATLYRNKGNALKNLGDNSAVVC